MPTPLPQPFEVTPGPYLNAMRMGSADRLAEEQRGALKTAGGFAAQGQLGQARNYLYQQGMVDEGAKFGQMIRQADADSLAKTQRQIEMVGDFALKANTPEAWAAGIPQLVKQGIISPDHAAQYQDFASRDAALAKAGKTLEMLKFEQDRRRLDIASQKNDITEEKNAASADSKAAGILSDEAVNQTADFYIKSGGKMPPLGQGSVGSTNRAKVMEAVTKQSTAQGGGASDILNNQVDLSARTAGARTGGTQEAKMTIASQEIANLAPIALEKMDALAESRGSFLPMNQLVEMVQKGTNDPRIREAALANQSLVSNYAAVIGRGSPQITDSAREHAENLLKTTFDKESYHAVVNLMIREANIAKKAPAQIREQNRREHSGSGAAALPETPGARTRLKYNPATGDFD